MAYSRRILSHCYWNLYFILLVYSVVFILYNIYTNLFFGYINQNQKYLEASDVGIGTHGEAFQFTGLNLRRFLDIFRYFKISNYWKNTEHDSLVKTFYDNRKTWNSSKLGAILFKNEPYPVLSIEQAKRTYVILIYKKWEFLQTRHIYNFRRTRKNPLQSCSVRNCIFSRHDTDLTTADAVIVHLFKNIMIPKTTGRKPHQRWIFLDDEAPRKYAFSLGKRDLKLSEMHNLFNWSMTYRTISDVPVPYGRTVPLKVSKVGNLTNIIPNWAMKRNDVLAAILISNCKVAYRNTALMAMQKYLKDRMHLHGTCAEKRKFKKSCPGHFGSDCPVMSKYLFYIVLENSKCKEYMTEKLFHNAYARGAIPVIQGPSMKDCEELLPPNSYLHFDNFTTIRHLVQKMVSISKSKENLLFYHKWRYHFDVRNEHGFFGSKSYHLCRVCEALNYNDKSMSVYSENDLKKYMNRYNLCRLSVPDF